MRKNQKGFSVTAILILLAVVIVLGATAYYVIKNQTRVSVTNNGATFSFDMGVAATRSTGTDSTGTSEFYQVKLDDYAVKVVATAYAPQKTKVTGDITCPYTAFKATINRAPHTVCNQKDIAFIADFNDGDKWYQANVFPQDLKTPLKQDTVKKVLESLRIEQ
jgi:hypothetical protein